MLAVESIGLHIMAHMHSYIVLQWNTTPALNFAVPWCGAYHSQGPEQPQNDGPPRGPGPSCISLVAESPLPRCPSASLLMDPPLPIRLRWYGPKSLHGGKGYAKHVSTGHRIPSAVRREAHVWGVRPLTWGSSRARVWIPDVSRALDVCPGSKRQNTHGGTVYLLK